MIGMTFAATLGFAFGASFKSGWVLVHGAVAAATSTLTFATAMHLL